MDSVQYYVFDDEQVALEAEATICRLAGVPIKGVNARTGKVSDIGETTRWDVPLQRADGKWVFRRVPDDLQQTVGPDAIEQFRAAFPYTLEDYNEDWFPVEED